MIQVNQTRYGMLVTRHGLSELVVGATAQLFDNDALAVRRDCCKIR